MKDFIYNKHIYKYFHFNYQLFFILIFILLLLLKYISPIDSFLGKKSFLFYGYLVLLEDSFDNY